MKTTKQQLGSKGEHIARLFLKEKGYTIVANNFYTRFGELDIIAYRDYPIHGKTLCFIEVKTRSKNTVSAARATNIHKQQHMQRAALAFCQKKGIATDHTPIQFEHLSIYLIAERLAKVYHYVIPIP